MMDSTMADSMAEHFWRETNSAQQKVVKTKTVEQKVLMKDQQKALTTDPQKVVMMALMTVEPKPKALMKEQKTAVQMQTVLMTDLMMAEQTAVAIATVLL